MKKNTSMTAEEKALESWASVIIEKLETMKSDVKWQKPWFTEKASRWPVNLSGREYCANNAILLMMLAEKNNYELPIWGTFNRFTHLNYQYGENGPVPLKDKDGNDMPRVKINKGEKSTSVFLTTYTVVHKDTKEKIPYEVYRELESDKKVEYNVYPKMHVYQVFNVQQTNLKEVRPEMYEQLLSKCKGEKRERKEGESRFPVYDKMIAEQRWFCPIDIAYRDSSYYSISRDKIFMPEPTQFKDEESFVGTLTHEAIHSLGNESRCNRFTPTTFNENDVAKEEMVAELGAALVCQRLGALKYVKSDSIPYLKSWIDSIRESPKFLKSVLYDVKKAYFMLIDRLEEIQSETEQNSENNE